jgi:hypothetical protein
MSLDSTAGVWRWRESAAIDSRRHEKSRLRRQAVIQALVTAVIGLIIDRLLEHHTFAIVLWSIAGIVFLLGLAWPRGYQPVHRFGALLGRLGGGLLVYVLLVPLYYLLFFPVSLWLRARGRDPLHRAPRGQGFTYWIRRRATDQEPDYRRQFLIEDRRTRNELRPVDAQTANIPNSGHDDREGVS